MTAASEIITSVEVPEGWTRYQVMDRCWRVSSLCKSVEGYFYERTWGWWVEVYVEGDFHRCFVSWRPDLVVLYLQKVLEGLDGTSTERDIANHAQLLKLSTSRGTVPFPLKKGS